MAKSYVIDRKVHPGPYHVTGADNRTPVALLPGVPLAFEDPDAGPFLVALGIAEESDLEPPYTYSQAEVDFDPRTTAGHPIGDIKTGQRILANPVKDVAAYEAAAAARGELIVEPR